MTDQNMQSDPSPGEKAYPRLFAPLRVGRSTLQNRAVILPHGTSMLRDGAITDRKSVV